MSRDGGEREEWPLKGRHDVCPAVQEGKASEYNLDAIEDKVRVCQADVKWQVSVGGNGHVFSTSVYPAT